ANAGGAAGVTVTVKAATDTEANTYPVSVITTVGAEQFTTDLSVEITGSYSSALADTQVFSARGPAGAVTEQTFTIDNTGTAPVTDLVMSATPASGRQAKVDPTSTRTLAQGQPVIAT